MRKFILALLLIVSAALPVSAQLMPWGACRTSGCTMTGPILLPDGSANVPSAAFASDADGTGTGFWRRAANQIGIAANGTDAFFISNTVIGSASTNTRDLGTSSLFFRHLYTGRIVTGAATPTTSCTGIGSTGTAVVDTGSSDAAGTITVTAGGAGIAATGTLTITFSSTNGALGTNEPVVVVTPRNGTGAWNARVSMINTAASTTAVQITWENNAIALSSGSTYKFNYHVFGK